MLVRCHLQLATFCLFRLSVRPLCCSLRSHSHSTKNSPHSPHPHPSLPSLAHSTHSLHYLTHPTHPTHSPRSPRAPTPLHSLRQSVSYWASCRSTIPGCSLRTSSARSCRCGTRCSTPSKYGVLYFFFFSFVCPSLFPHPSFPPKTKTIHS